MVVEIVCNAAGKDNNLNLLIFAQLFNHFMQSKDGLRDDQIYRGICKFDLADLRCRSLYADRAGLCILCSFKRYAATLFIRLKIPLNDPRSVRARRYRGSLKVVLR